MLQIYCCSIDALPESCSSAELTEAQKRSLCGRMLARKLLSKLSGIAEADIKIAVAANGKPFAENLPFSFNISHSGSLVVCAAGDSSIGIDLQKIKPVSYALAKRIFSQKERTLLFGRAVPSKEDVERLNQSDAPQNWYRLWCGKEALSKYSGDGLSRELLNADLDALLKEKKLVLSYPTVAEGYCCAVVSGETADEVTWVTLK